MLNASARDRHSLFFWSGYPRPVPGKYYVPSDARADRVADLFATIAPRYDLINDLQSLGLHRWWKRRMIRLAQIQQSDQALDVCCGTGDVAFQMAAAGAEVTGVDFSEPMLSVARSRGAKLGSQVRFLRGDALALPFSDSSFDVLTISYGLRNLADWEAGLKEFKRVLKPGARLLVLDFGKPDLAAWRWLYFQYLRHGVPRFGRWFFGDADTHGYILDSLIAYPAQRGVDAGLRQLGFGETRIFNLFGGIMAINLARKAS
ncbi:MAG TPA: bifunctional demethylmenaquinone methyltransferase/2-methoxy-6-polyprenyl-1,4-benzoquinol methylase UbiE [Verrucomicrobiales bacterium]|nr:bifunctional demethylmenaquinone methyltransferase/2-methoxy-6-polyprenyl-1,4-benzoquinol methylase UbiE [Verrucomicrobiales bacterium]